MAPRSLVHICLRIAMENSNLITSLYGVPAAHVQTILRAVKSADQLYTLEVNEPSIACETAPHWQRIINQEFPLLSKQLDWAPQNPQDWHKVYAKYKEKQVADDREATEALKKSFAAKQVEHHSRQATIISSTKALKQLPKLPKDGRGSFGVKGSSAESSSGRDGSRTKSAFFKKVRRDAKIDAMRRSMSTPTGQLIVKPGQLARAPESMINMKRIEKLPALPQPPTIRAPRMMAQVDAIERQRKEREARLLKIKNTVAAGSNILVFADDSGDNEPSAPAIEKHATPMTRKRAVPVVDLVGSGDDSDDGDDLFGDKHFGAASSPSPSPSPTAPSPPAATPSGNPVAGTKRKRGLLSNSPGANARTSGGISAVKRPETPKGKPKEARLVSSPPSLKILVESSPVSPEDRVKVVKKKPVDIFMKTNKRQKTSAQ